MSVLNLAKQLIEIESISGNEAPMSKFLKAFLEPRGWTVVIQEVAPGRENVYAHRGFNPELLFNSHIDTVPPYIGYSEDSEWIYGRGACDTKSLIAAQLMAAENLVQSGYERIGLLYVVGEEVDHCGMIKANELQLNPKFLIVGEPTESTLASRQKGVLKVKLSAKGKAAHSGYPHTGISAVEPLVDVLYELRHYPWPKAEALGETTLNIGLLRAGKAANVIPDDAWAEVMIRVVTSQHDVLQQVESIVKGRVEVQVIAANDPHNLSTVDGYATSVVSFNTDIPYLKFDGKAFLYGPGSILDAHTAGEKIRKGDVENAVDVYATLAKSLLDSI